jgi:hypothetical protein
MKAISKLSEILSAEDFLLLINTIQNQMGESYLKLLIETTTDPSDFVLNGFDFSCTKQGASFWFNINCKIVNHKLY